MQSHFCAWCQSVVSYWGDFGTTFPASLETAYNKLSERIRPRKSEPAGQLLTHVLYIDLQFTWAIICIEKWFVVHQGSPNFAVTHSKIVKSCYLWIHYVLFLYKIDSELTERTLPRLWTDVSKGRLSGFSPTWAMCCSSQGEEPFSLVCPIGMQCSRQSGIRIILRSQALVVCCSSVCSAAQRPNSHRLENVSILPHWWCCLSDQAGDKRGIIKQKKYSLRPQNDPKEWTLCSSNL